jgi:hypothetical protein
MCVVTTEHIAMMQCTSEHSAQLNTRSVEYAVMGPYLVELHRERERERDALESQRIKLGKIRIDVRDISF